jgi:hypothetical protein
MTWNWKGEWGWIPNLRTKFVADDGRDFGDLGYIFAEWLETRPESEYPAWCKRGYLTREQCRSFWSYIGRTDKAPKRLRIDKQPWPR